jgi:hypothetical protein
MTDRVIEEIRERRRNLIKTRYGGSVDRVVASSCEWQKMHPRKVANLRRITAARAIA